MRSRGDIDPLYVRRVEHLALIGPQRRFLMTDEVAHRIGLDDVIREIYDPELRLPDTDILDLLCEDLTKLISDRRLGLR